MGGPIGDFGVVWGSLYDEAPSGYVKVTVLDSNNNNLAEGKLITKTVTDAQVQWKDGFAIEN